MTSGDLGGAEVEMHAVVVAGDGLDVEVAESVNLQLKCQSWFQMTVDHVFLKLIVRENRYQFLLLSLHLFLSLLPRIWLGM